MDQLLVRARQLTTRQWTFILIGVSGAMVLCAAIFGCFPVFVTGLVTSILNGCTEEDSPDLIEPPASSADTPVTPIWESRVVDLSTLTYDHSLDSLHERFANGQPIDLTSFRSKGEKICAQTLMTIFDQPFVSVRPDWLRNPLTGRCLELDCYNEELGLAVEYNGVQHYEAGHFDMSEADLVKQQGRDAAKAESCSRHGVLLITVPYTVAHRDVPGYIAKNIPQLFRKRTIYFKGSNGR